ncbi:hypothetical protein CEUSTIGMA_g7868.t1 [Chlamydomonas eustigma]|uniref:Uncharacterized protein n=1 Tax=Chlamydomonas eustigma TaxID=1157962 RepID=A0A250XC02_9CHLO|nr:hypothetical protein CEUSTIGMA_g7868.t1 [Chlamydomonas eustigma]|eukprot:GAX80429.1 hypothetical protein CEUSTIGMA_g7868.t1 [Chlamydomonas eustigma]
MTLLKYQSMLNLAGGIALTTCRSLNHTKAALKLTSYMTNSFLNSNLSISGSSSPTAPAGMLSCGFAATSLLTRSIPQRGLLAIPDALSCSLARDAVTEFLKFSADEDEDC